MLALVCSSQLWESNSAGYVQVKQAAGTGEMSVRLEPGMYWQGMGSITDYRISDVFDFNNEKISVKFNDGSTAEIGGQAQFRLPLKPDAILKIHTDFRSYDAVVQNLVKKLVAASLKQAANLFRAEEVYSTRRADFIDLVTDQIREGIYATTWREEWVKDQESDKETLIRRVEIRRDKAGEPIVNDVSTFKIYDVDLVGQILINDIDFDDLTDGLIAKRKEAEQNQVVARANAERAKQDAITAMEEGKRDIARAEASALVEKKTAVVEAEKQTEIKKQQALQAEEDKKALIARGEGEAAATKLKVAAGLSPLEKATIDANTAIGVAEKMSQIKFPAMMIIGGGGNGQVINPFDAVGLKSFIDISKAMSDGQANH